MILRPTIKSIDDTNHHPVLRMNGNEGKEVIYINAKPVDSISLDASASHDPDKNALTYSWFHYKETGYNCWMQ